VCRETGPHRSGRGRRKRTRATGTSSAAYFTVARADVHVGAVVDDVREVGLRELVDHLHRLASTELPGAEPQSRDRRGESRLRSIQCHSITSLTWGYRKVVQVDMPSQRPPALWAIFLVCHRRTVSVVSEASRFTIQPGRIVVSSRCRRNGHLGHAVTRELRTLGWDTWSHERGALRAMRQHHRHGVRLPS
jgi:hypothetical protein